ncbi:hypothetical protein TRVL_08857 [Trypanosoma vivax]|nr:hypothetical protein TRVL_08857 [Trypanosoma vivax]
MRELKQTCVLCGERLVMGLPEPRPGTACVAARRKHWVAPWEVGNSGHVKLEVSRCEGTCCEPQGAETWQRAKTGAKRRGKRQAASRKATAVFWRSRAAQQQKQGGTQGEQRGGGRKRRRHGQAGIKRAQREGTWVRGHNARRSGMRANEQAGVGFRLAQTGCDEAGGDEENGLAGNGPSGRRDLGVREDRNKRGTKARGRERRRERTPDGAYAHWSGGLAGGRNRQRQVRRMETKRKNPLGSGGGRAGVSCGLVVGRKGEPMADWVERNAEDRERTKTKSDAETGRREIVAREKGKNTEPTSGWPVGSERPFEMFFVKRWYDLGEREKSRSKRTRRGEEKNNQQPLSVERKACAPEAATDQKGRDRWRWAVTT